MLLCQIAEQTLGFAENKFPLLFKCFPLLHYVDCGDGAVEFQHPSPVAGADSIQQKIHHENGLYGVIYDPQDYPKNNVTKSGRWSFGQTGPQVP